jgi:DNA-binding NarL/FixJ family response regulator
MRQTTIVIIDDHPLFRQGVVDILSMERDLIIVGQASNGINGLQMIREKKPDVAIIDVNLPGMNGQQVTRNISLEKLDTRVILLTAYDDADQKIHAVRSGAAAYCTKDVRPLELIETLRKISSVDQKVDREDMNQWMVNRTCKAVGSDIKNPLRTVSNREMEVLTYLAQGMSNKEIAALLKISQQTVKNHVTAILRKLEVSDRTQAAIFALHHGWVRIEEPYPSVQE